MTRWDTLIGNGDSLEGPMQERIAHLSIILEALGKLLAYPEGLPLHTSKSLDGAFPGTTAGKQASRQALLHGWVVSLETIVKGKVQVQLITLSDAGIDFLKEQGNSRNILNQIKERLPDHWKRIQSAEESLNECKTILMHLESHAKHFGSKLEQHGSDWSTQLAGYLSARHLEKPAEDCPLPELYAKARSLKPDLSVGQFHDGLRRMHENRELYLHPWTGPLHELPEPGMALMIGHALAYYASPRAA